MSVAVEAVLDALELTLLEDDELLDTEDELLDDDVLVELELELLATEDEELEELTLDELEFV